MRQIIIRKGAKVRAVYAPEGTEGRRSRKLARQLAAFERAAARSMSVESVSHGFVAGRSPVTAATAHIGAAVTISLDLSGWYDSVTPTQVVDGLEAAGLPAAEATRLGYAACQTADYPSPRPGELAPRQGMPSSPAAANIAAVLLDAAIVRSLAPSGERYVYTRYADDIVVSLFDTAVRLGRGPAQDHDPAAGRRPPRDLRRIGGRHRYPGTTRVPQTVAGGSSLRAGFPPGSRPGRVVRDETPTRNRGDSRCGTDRLDSGRHADRGRPAAG